MKCHHVTRRVYVHVRLYAENQVRPSSGFTVCGVEKATQDATLVRKCTHAYPNANWYGLADKLCLPLHSPAIPSTVLFSIMVMS